MTLPLPAGHLDRAREDGFNRPFVAQNYDKFVRLHKNFLYSHSLRGEERADTLYREKEVLFTLHSLRDARKSKPMKIFRLDQSSEHSEQEAERLSSLSPR